jgi:hypothetical protein
MITNRKTLIDEKLSTAHHISGVLQVYTRSAPAPVCHAYLFTRSAPLYTVRHGYLWASRNGLPHLTRSTQVRRVLWVTKLLVAHGIGGALRVI